MFDSNNFRPKLKRPIINEKSVLMCVSHCKLDIVCVTHTNALELFAVCF